MIHKKRFFFLFFFILLAGGWGFYTYFLSQKEDSILNTKESFVSADLKKEELVLNVYNWTDNIDPKVIAEFEKETGIKVNYDVYDSDEVLEAKLLLGNSGYDLVFPSANPFFARQIKAGIYKPIDRKKLSNYKNLDPAFLKKLEEIDPENTYGVPYFWGTIGIAYVPEKLKALWPEKDPHELAQSWALLYDPNIVQRFQSCGVSLQSSALDVFNSVLVYLGFNPNSTSEAEGEQAIQLLKKIRPFIRKFSSGALTEELVNGEICLALGWSGDVLQAKMRAKEINQNFSIEYALPSKGAEIWFEIMAIPSDAPHPENAYKFINFILRPDVIAKISQYVFYASPNEASLSYLPKNIKENPIIYPPSKIMDHLFISKNSPVNFERWRSRSWIRIKTGT